MTDNKEITLVVNSCDNYSDCWEPFFKLFSVFWPDCPYQIVLNTETRSYNFPNIDIKCQNIRKKTSYSQRLIYVLEHISSPYVLIMLDDFFIKSKVNKSRIEQCKEWMKKDDTIALFSFESVNDPLNKISNQYPDFVLRPQFAEYKLNLQAGLWRKSILIEYLQSDESPWEFEILGNIRTFKGKHKFYALDEKAHRIIDYRNNNGIYPYKWGIVGGKWVLDTVESLFKEHGIEVDYSVRGIYNPEKGKNFTLSLSKRRIIKGIGFIKYIQIYYWGYFRKILEILGISLPSSYYEYKRLHS